MRLQPLAILALTTLLACGDKDGGGEGEGDVDTDGGGGTGGDDAPVDRDGDGVDAGADCDDGDPAIHPGAAEACDGVDNDCDGAIDEGVEDAPTWYADADADGHGDPDNAVQACTRPEGYTADATDCDDTDEQVSPSAQEWCDGDDEDCDGLIDADDPDTAGGVTWYADDDGDGHGDASRVTVSCEQPSGTVLDDTDCDDTDATLHPSADEVCDGVDNDCDGLVDDEDDVLVGGDTFYTDADGDGHGDAGAAVQACVAPSGTVEGADDCDDTDAAISPSADEVCDGVDNDCDTLVDDDDTVSGGGTTFHVDADGDGYGGATTVEACSQPSGTTLSQDDCDDSDAAVNPGGTEVCGGADEDCDGLVDDADPSVTATTTWYLDYDSDGYGGSAFTTDACVVPGGYAATADDCDDTDADIHPAGTETCNGVDDDCDGLTDDDDTTVDPTSLTVFYADADGDGHGTAGSSTTACTQPSGYATSDDDCDDTDAAVSPSQTESCSGVDDDCDGLVDEADPDVTGTTTLYADSDGDGYGDASTSTAACATTSGWVSDATDCDDADADVNPGATETCSGVDDDCDGLVDDADSSVTGTSTWYLDFDGDDHGSSATSTDSCAAPSGYVASSDDCDDTDAATNPDADEVCNGVDDDCDGDADDADSLVLASSLSAFYLDGDGDGYGLSGSATTACALPSGYAAADGDCDDADSAVNPGATETCSGVDDDCDGLVDADDPGVLGASTVYPDTDGDGYGAEGFSLLTCSVPSGYISSGGDCDDGDATAHPGGTEICGDGVDQDCSGSDSSCGSSGGGGGGGSGRAGDLVDAADAIQIWLGDSRNERLGEQVSPAGDIDGDGNPDLWLGTESAAHQWLVYGPFTGGEVDMATATTALKFDSTDTSPGIAESVGTGGDLDGDGQDDALVLAAYVDNGSFSNAGAAYVWFGPLSGTGTQLLSTADLEIAGTSTAAYIGTMGMNVGDVNGDGEDDLVVGGWRSGAYSGGYAGSAYLFHGPLSGGSLDTDDADAHYQGTVSYGYVGREQTRGGGDLDGDGLADLAISAYGTYGGYVYVLYGPASTTGDLPTIADVTFQGQNGNDGAGFATAIPGDLDGDGNDDLAIGAYGWDKGAQTNAGRAYLLYGPVSSGDSLAFADARMDGPHQDAYLGWSLDGLQDLDGDGADELVVGSRQDDERANNAGAAFVLHGPLSGAFDMQTDYDTKVLGEDAADYFGDNLTGAGDVDGDGLEDLLVGAMGSDEAPYSYDEGRVFLMSGADL